MSVPVSQLKQTGEEALDRFLQKTVQDKKVPAAFLGATNKDGELYFECGGDRVFGKPDEGQVTPDTVLQLFSMTKFMTSIACWQLVDQGLVSMDDSEIIAKHLPELDKLPILKGYTDDGKEILEEAKNKITLKMLLSHSSGLAYAFNSELLVRYSAEHKLPFLFAPNAPASAYAFPLLFEPGTRFQYGVGIDWAGFLVARITGLSLEEYFQKNIFKPCGVTTMSFFPPDDHEKSMMAMCEREPVHTGDIKVMKGPAMGRPFKREDIGPDFSGGGGLFGTARDYLKVLTAVLASSDPEAKSPLISSKSFRALFVNALADTPTMKADLAKMAQSQHIHDPAILTEGTGEHVGYSPGLFLNSIDSKWGRLGMSGFWDGAAKTMFWIDPKTGVAAVCCTNLLAHNPDPWNQVYNTFERTLYDNLE